MDEVPEIDIVIGSYGFLDNGVYMTRQTAQRWADEQVGHTLNPHLFHLSNGAYRVLSVRLDDEPSQPQKGRVIATCQVIAGHPASSMEVK